MSILDEANRVRADVFLKTLVETRKLKPYLRCISSRSDDAFVRAIIQRIRNITEIGVEDIIEDSFFLVSFRQQFLIPFFSDLRSSD